ncbi:MAG: VanZ family protein [Oscillospiraceae bacterium]|nr:VanZ family protein [Oscillospiraceae bacterium]
MLPINKFKYIISWIPVAILMIIIFCFSAQEAAESMETSQSFSDTFFSILFPDIKKLSAEKQAEIIESCQFIVRKAAHFSVYGLLGILTCTASRFSRFKFYPLISAGICLLYAVSDEIHQNFVEGRSCEFRDVMIDFGGSVTGIAGIILIIQLIQKIKGANYDRNKCI